jgi:Eco57I restriction-modification methylase/MmeI, target recognition domain
MSLRGGGGRARGHAPRTSGFDHSGWLGLVEVSGPFLSIPVLRRAWPAGLDSLDRPARAKLRAEHADYFDVPAAERDRDHWVRYVLADLLGWAELLRWGEDIDTERLTLADTEHGEEVTPSFGLAGRDGAFRLLGLLCDGPPTGRVARSGWAASPADRLALLLRRHDVPLGLATDGRWWVLVWAPRGKATTQAAFDASLWREERDLLRAFVSLLSRTRFFGVPDEEMLPALLEKSQDNAEEITEALGIQVRRAVELLIGAIGLAEEEVRRRRPDVPPLEAHEAYVGAVGVMMRLVFLFFAEERHLLPNDDPVYEAYYSAGRLVDELERRASEPGGEAALEFTDVGWHRLLALFRAIHGGVNAGTLHLPPYDGSLFDPDEHPWLEGRFGEEDEPGADVLRIDDRTVLHMLRAVQYVEVGTGKGRERRRLSFAAVDVEQIGYVYEGLLGFDAFRADDDVLGLTGRPGEEEEVALTDMEDHAAAVAAERGDIRALAERLADRYKDSGIGSPAAVAKKLAPLTDEELADARRRLLSATGNDLLLADRLLPFYRLLRPDLSGLPTVFRKGTMYVTQSPLRRFTGTHYTPRFLAEQVVEGALEPLVYSPGPLQTADAKQWKLRSSSEILNLKIADIAMGSAAFLVAASRYLAARLIEAWIREGDQRAARWVADTASAEDSDDTIDTENHPDVVNARRLIIEHCLYGVDINPMAVEMAKLSLWLTSMDPSKPFTFVDDKLVCGDSLLGITSLDQLEWMHLDIKRGRKLHENIPWAWNRSATQLAIEVAGLRERISRLSDSPGDYAKKRELLGKAEEQVEQASQLASLVTGAALAEAGKRYRNLDAYMMAADLTRKVAEGKEDWDNVTEKAQEWLNIDHVPGSFSRTPLQWPLVFPEVFLEKSGFDAIVGNPPFLGGPKIRPALGASYREMLVRTVGEGVRSTNADLIAFFARRAHRLLNESGQAGLIATNTLAQGDTREAGLDPLASHGVTIRQAIRSAAWPSRSAVLEYCVIWTSRVPLSSYASRRLDGLAVKGITSSLDAESRVTGLPNQLAANDGICNYGSDPFGMGFTLEEDAAQQMIRNDPRNARVLFSFLNGDDVNSKPDSAASRWIINFYDWNEEEAAAYHAPFDHVRRLVKPDRATKSKEVRQWPWWRYWRSRPALYAAIAELQRVIVIARTSKLIMPAIVPARQVFSNALAVFATDDNAIFAFISSAQHYWWALSRGSSMRTDLRYTPADVFGTLSLPSLTQEMLGLGDWLDGFRRELMLARQAGLTKTYNLVHDPRCKDSDIAELREIHRQIDHAVARAYGWDDLELDHGFHETRQGTRYTVGPEARQEILDRLLELNHERYAVEVAAGLHDKKRRKDGAGEQMELGS